jgi:hypothetical protein
MLKLWKAIRGNTMPTNITPTKWKNAHNHFGKSKNKIIF